MLNMKSHCLRQGYNGANTNAIERQNGTARGSTVFMGGQGLSFAILEWVRVLRLRWGDFGAIGCIRVYGFGSNRGSGWRIEIQTKDARDGGWGCRTMPPNDPHSDKQPQAEKNSPFSPR
jgi:hypothetical protein